MRGRQAATVTWASDRAVIRGFQIARLRRKPFASPSPYGCGSIVPSARIFKNR
jgi:hypothetical protein